MAHGLFQARSRLLFSLMVFSSPLGAQTLTSPARSITLPRECQHPFRELYRYGGGQRLGLKVKSGFCRVDVVSGNVKMFSGLEDVKTIAPAPKSLLVAAVSGFYRLKVLNDMGQSQFEGDLDSSGWTAIYWSNDESHVVVLSFRGEGDEADTATIVNLTQKKMKSIDFNPPVPVRFDAKSETIRAETVNGKTRKVAVYDLEGKLLPREAPQNAQRERIESPNRTYYYFPKYEIGEGDTSIRKSSSGDVTLRLPEYKSVHSRNAALWDNPQWNPVDDNLLLALYLPSGFGKEGIRGEIDVFSVSQGKVVRAFPVEEKATPAYGWSADGKHVVLCDVDCSFHSVP
ncbi:MAG: hypothetical protein ABSE19_02050 [Candidatus Acidiferrum sp.]|jgi:hypothetical protein